MVPYHRWFTALGLALAGWLALAAPAAAQKNKPVPLNGVDDKAGLFSDQAISKARNEIQEIKRRTRKDLVIQTFPNPPERYKGQRPEAFMSSWAKRNFDDLGVDGVYVLICKSPPYVQVAVGTVTSKTGAFTAAERDELAKLILSRLDEVPKIRKAAGPDADKKAVEKKMQEARDQALLAAVTYVRENMVRAGQVAGQQGGKGAPGGGRAPEGRQEEDRPGGIPGWVGWVCVGLVVLLVVWLVIGIIRGLTNRGAPGSGGPGYAGGGGGYGGGGGGGGGFFSSLLGGMFGAAAGMWMYSHFFGGSTPHAGAAPPPAAGGGDDYQSDVGAGSTTSGGEYGGDDGGGGGGGGGGDWGGGDAGGGGGGGDWGGDAGGGGGGDWGGGGGDWGGGGGGGDWGGGGGGGGGDW
jgi:hypothetical protein